MGHCGQPSHPLGSRHEASRSPEQSSHTLCSRHEASRGPGQSSHSLGSRHETSRGPEQSSHPLGSRHEASRCPEQSPHFGAQPDVRCHAENSATRNQNVTLSQILLLLVLQDPNKACSSKPKPMANSSTHFTTCCPYFSV